MPNSSELLARLRQDMGKYVSGEELSEQLGVSRTAVWKYIHQLEASGYQIEAAPHLGYRLLQVPDSLIPDEIKHDLKTRCFGRNVVSFKETTSTNDRALELAGGGASQGTLVTAEMQTRGRGRRERTWISKPNANLLFSLVLRPAWSVEQASLVTLMMAIAVAKSIRRETGLPAQIKWPNDVLIENLKVAGILTEMRVQANEIAYVACGIGINVNQAPSPAQIKTAPGTPPKETGSGALRYPAGSLAGIAGRPVPRLPLLRRFLFESERLYFQALKEGFQSALKEWGNLSMMTGSQAVIELADGSLVEGVVMGVDDSGALLIRQESGVTQRITSGECRVVKKTKIV